MNTKHLADCMLLISSSFPANCLLCPCPPRTQQLTQGSSVFLLCFYSESTLKRVWQRGFQQSSLSEAATHQEAIVWVWWLVVTICCSLTSNQTKQSSPLLALSVYLPPTFYRSGSSATRVGGWTRVTSTSALSTKCTESLWVQCFSSPQH